MLNSDDLEAFGYYDSDYAEDVERWKTPAKMVKEYAALSGQEPDAQLYENLIAEEYHEWSIEYPDNNGLNCDGEPYHPVNELKELADLVYVIYGYALAKNWDLEEAVRRVHQSNIGRMRQDDGTILRREDGKVIKNPNTPKVNLSDLV